MILSPSYRSGTLGSSYIYDFETNAPHYIWTGQHDKKYNLAMHNFLGEVPRFFLKDERLTTFASKRGPFTMVSGTTYYMDVVLEKTPDFIMYEGPHIYMQETNPSSGLVKYSSGSARGLHYGPACDILGTSEVRPAKGTITAASTTISAYENGGNGGLIYITDADNTQIKYQFGTDGDEGATGAEVSCAGVGGNCTMIQINGKTTVAQIAAEIAEAINSSEGHGTSGANTIRVTDNGDGSLLLRTDGTTAGNNAITTGILSANEVTVSGFSGGRTSLIRGRPNSNYNWLSNIQDPAFAPYTPPYFYGESVARISFSPHQHRELLSGEGPQEYTLDEIFEGAKLETVYEPNRTASYAQAVNLTKTPGTVIHNPNTTSEDLGSYITVPDEHSLAGIGKMKIDSSVNLFGKTRVKEVTYEVAGALENKYSPVSAKDSADSDFDVWTISTKFETPTLNFSGNAKGHFTRGMWFGYGEQPKPDQGIYLRLRESFPERTGQTLAMKKLTANPFIGGSAEANEVGSLMDICGFAQAGTSTKRKIGQIADKKLISEAVVAIPFKAKTQSSRKRFFNISKDYIDVALNRASKHIVKKCENKGIKIGKSICQMIEKMQKYVIPPHHDFVTNREVSPFVMYIFEFEHTLDREDLSNIWQNLMPKIATTPEMEEVEITHPCGMPGEFFESGDIPSDIKWMVYKIKRKAETNYFNVTADSQDDDRFKFEFKTESEKITPDYSYNWPYDFFSLVELGKLEVGIKLTDKNSKTEIDSAKPTIGTTSKDEGHTHAFIVDSSGNGIAQSACHPIHNDVCHEHKIINWKVQTEGSELSSPHTHKIK